MKISVSELLTHQTCPQKRWFLYHQKITGKRLEKALELGTAFHELMENSLREKYVDGVQLALEPEWWMAWMVNRLVKDWESRGIDPDDYASTLREAQALGKWAWWFWRDGNHPKWKEVLAIEEPLEIEYGPELVLRGKVDAVVMDYQKNLWHLQWKTIAASARLENYVRKIKRSLHEALYKELIQANYPEHNYMGTRLQVFKKSPMRKRVGGQLIERSPEEAVFGIDLNINEAQAERAKRDIFRLAMQIENENIPNNLTLEQRENSCLGPFGNTPCYFIDICDGLTGVNDNHLFEPWDPYAGYK